MYIHNIFIYIKIQNKILDNITNKKKIYYFNVKKKEK